MSEGLMERALPSAQVRDAAQHARDALSIVTYYASNKRKIAPVFLILALAVFGVTTSVVLTGSIQDTARDQLTFYERIVTVTPNYQARKTVVDPDVKAEIRRSAHQLATYPYLGLSTYVPLIIGGNTSSQILAVNTDAIPTILAASDLHLKEGRLPFPNANEIVLHKQVAKARGLRVGSELDREKDVREWLYLKLLVVGIIDGPVSVNFTSLEYVENQRQYRTATQNVLILPRPGEMEPLQRDLAALPRNKVQVNDFAYWKQRFNQELGSMDAMIWAINAVVIFVLSLAVGLLNMIYFLQRMNEFGLLLAVGYTRRFLIWRAIRESMVLTAVAWLAGIGLSELIYRGLNAVVFDPRGITLGVMNLRAIQFTLPIPICVGLFSLGTVVWQLTRLDPLSIIDRRD